MQTGLSLCIQGTQNFDLLAANLDRFIPVYTGNTNYSNLKALANAVYPCVYREHHIHHHKIVAKIGLSLCIQGTLLLIQSELNLIAVYPCVYREHPYYNLLFIN